MEIMNAKETEESHASFSTNSDVLITSNWYVSNNKEFVDAITTAPIQYAPARIEYEDVVSIDTCIALQPICFGTDSNTEPCRLDIVTNNQKIARIAVVSEGNVLEIFKQYGEYETTIVAEFIDEYEGNIVFLGETMINPPSTEVGIKFIRTKNKGPPMWVYGIRLFFADSTKEAKPSAFDYDDIIRTFLSNTSNSKMNRGPEMAKKIFGFHKEEIMNREKFLETLASGSRYYECINEIGSDNEKKFPNCEDDCEQLNASECENGIIKRNDETGYLNCRENYKRSDADIKTYIDKSEFSKKTEPGTFNYEDFIQPFLSNAGNDKMSQEPDMTEMFELDKMINENRKFLNAQLSQMLRTLYLNPCKLKLEAATCETVLAKQKYEFAKRKNDRDNEIEMLLHQSCKVDHEKSDSFEYKNRNIRRNSDKNCTNCEDYKKSDIDIRIYIDNKFHDMEKRLMERINKMEASTNQKLDAILERLDSRLNLQ